MADRNAVHGPDVLEGLTPISTLRGNYDAPPEPCGAVGEFQFDAGSSLLTLDSYGHGSWEPQDASKGALEPQGESEKPTMFFRPGPWGMKPLWPVPDSEESVDPPPRRSDEEEEKEVDDSEDRAVRVEPERERPKENGGAMDGESEETRARTAGDRATTTSPETESTGVQEQLGDYIEQKIIEAAEGSAGIIVDLGREEAEAYLESLRDLLNLGEGIRKGTLEGLWEDTWRILNVTPAGYSIKGWRRLGAMARQMTTNVKAPSGGFSLPLRKKASNSGGKAGGKQRGKKGRKLSPELSRPYRDLKKQGRLRQRPTKNLEKPKGLGYRFQNWASGGKTHEYRGTMKDGTTLDIDDIRVGADGRLILREMKASNERLPDLDSSAHFQFGARLSSSARAGTVPPGVSLLKRYIQFAQENPQQVSSRIELVVTGRIAGESYLTILNSGYFSEAELQMFTFVDPGW